MARDRLDDNPSAVKSFLKTEEIPWVTLNDAQDQHPMAAHYGTMSIPQAFLVDRTGKVVSTRARGRELENQLAKLFAKGGPK